MKAERIASEREGDFTNNFSTLMSIGNGSYAGYPSFFHLSKYEKL
jgi:hypothetical protein